MYGKYNAFMLYLYFMTKIIIIEMLIYILLALILIHNINILTLFTQCIKIV